jgi:hypothetical protein
MTWRLLLAAAATTNNPLVTLITDDSPTPGSLARRRAIHPRAYAFSLLERLFGYAEPRCAG